MACVLACVDGSSYTPSVCDHAGWLAAGIDASVKVLHVVEPAGTMAFPGDPAALVESAVQRLRDEGVEDVTGEVVEGRFVEVSVGAGADRIVMGKRGLAHDQERGRIGSCVDVMVRATETPVCLTSRVFLPIDRVVALLDADLNHRRAVEFVASHPRLDRVHVDLVVASGDQDPEPKLAWAREMLQARGADIFAVEAEGPDEGIRRYLASRRTDLIVISRAVLLGDPAARLSVIEEQGVWAWRTPVLVC